MLKKELHDVLSAYVDVMSIAEIKTYGSGHINDTNLITLWENVEQTASRCMILQRINHAVFKDPGKLMENIMRVTEWLSKKIEARGGDVSREVLHVIPTKTGQSYYVSDAGNYYRMYSFIENGLCLDLPRTKADFYESGVMFGVFQGDLTDFPVKDLHESIPDFHNTVKRLDALKRAIEEDVCGLAHTVKEEIAFALSEEDSVTYCAECKKSLPVRVTHNDTKLNNVMLDETTQKALCVLDLDTVMPGYAMDDFGDSIRFGASTALEDEADLKKVSCDLSMFRAFTEGFIKGTGGNLTKEEILLLPLGAKMMTYECGIRFLMDYLQGNVYFKVAYPEHNLVRARNQFALVKDMNEKMDEMNQIMQEFV